MPHLRFDLSAPVSDDDRTAFAEWVAKTYGDVMDTGTDHVGVVVTETDPHLGRAGDDDPVAFVNADVRVGRTADQRHDLARRLTSELGERFGIPKEAVYVVFTEHGGADFVLGGDPLNSWSTEEAPEPTTEHSERD